MTVPRLLVLGIASFRCRCSSLRPVLLVGENLFRARSQFPVPVRQISRGLIRILVVLNRAVSLLVRRARICR